MIVEIPVKYKDDLGIDREGKLQIRFLTLETNPERFWYGGFTSMALITEGTQSGSE